VYLNITFRGFHFGQSLYRKVVEIGLKVQYQEDENLRKYVKKVISLAFGTNG
jgi:hypothetical protein